MYLTRVEIEQSTRLNTLSLLSQVQDTGIYIDIGCEGPGSTPSMPIDMVKRSKLTLLSEPRSEYYNETKIFYKNNVNVIINDSFITPDNINKTIIEPLGEEKNNVFVMDIDIDGYDFYLTESILKTGIKPTFLSLEINEKIPPPIKFSILYNNLYKFPNAHFYGMSIAKAEELTQYGYDLIQLFFNSLILVKKDQNPFYKDNTLYKAFKPRTALELYNGQYINNNLYKKIEYNQDVNFWQDIKDEQHLIETINKHFYSYTGKYEIYV